MKTVLISGAGVAGLAAAHWLHRRGYAPTVVERAPAPRPGGQAIDVRGVALDVLDRMDLLGRTRRARTRMRGMAVLDADGTEQWRSTEMTLSAGRLDGDDIEVLRDDLTALLHTRARDGVEYLFGDAITALDQDDDGVRVTFRHGGPRTFDLVVGADGLHSAVRRLVFGPEDEFVHHLGSYVGVFSTGNFLGLDDWQVWLHDDARTASYCLYPARGNTELRATLGFTSDPLDHDRHDVEHQKALIADRFAGVGWETPRLLKAMGDASDFYFDAMAQVRMGSWWRGRVVLVGDAAHCASPLSGQGTSLALVGAYVLADELGDADDPLAALTRYDRRLRPFVEVNQALATENPGQGASEESLERAKRAISLDTRPEDRPRLRRTPVA
ncbi:FAD-dependent monooxygenase [Actinosynnema sp. NPDC023587]|uniref:FAD-dependent monooxygenase n=1 Tax=Actinosynnema sp. NPDC023587 TaxID=3154695 RepID=UPI00341050D7